MINSFCGLFKHTNVIGSHLELSFVIVAVSVILLSIIPFHYQLTGATLATSTNQPNATVGPTPPSTKLFQNLTNSSLVVGDINATNLAQKQELISSHIRQHQPSTQIQQNQQMPQSYPPLQQLPPQPPTSQSQPQPPPQTYPYPPTPLPQQTVPLQEFGPPRESKDQFSMMLQLRPHENQYLPDYYQVLYFQFAISNPNELCPIQNCVFQLEGGVMGSESTPGERSLRGKLMINTGDTTRIRDLSAYWAAVEERAEGGQRVQVIEGTLTLGTDRLGTENRYQINGTLTPYGQDLMLAIQGSQQ
jgi:hypothetical protein